MAKLNPNEAPEGYIAIALHKSAPCTSCAFLNETGICTKTKGSCSGEKRADKTWVVFKRKTEKERRKPREWKGYCIVDPKIKFPLTAETDRIASFINDAVKGEIIHVKITVVVNAK